MEFLGIGPMELLFIIIIALIVLGPRDMAKAGRTIGKFMRDVVKSDTWKVVKTTTRELENLPNKLMREAGLEEELKEFKNFPHAVTAADLTRSIKPPAPPPAGNGTKPASPEEAAFIPDPPSEQDDHPESMPPSVPPEA